MSWLKLDGMDVQIIRALQKDARANFSDIGDSLGMSMDTVTNHFMKLKKMGVVKGTTIFVDPKGLGRECIASLEIDVDYPRVSEAVEFISKKDGVVFCTPSMGRHDIFALAILKNVETLSRLIESIKRNAIVREVAASLWVGDMLLCPENFDFDHIAED